MAPSAAFSLIRVKPNAPLRSIMARGVRTFVKTTEGPQKTPSSSVTPS
ncbi:hypothetical protein [Parafrankia colletiae]|nr:hypothetical protein [Parafrankia colletiae]